MSLFTDKELSDYSGRALDMNLMDTPRYLIEILDRIEKLENEVKQLKDEK